MDLSSGVELAKHLPPAPWYFGFEGNHWYVLSSPSTDSENRIAGPLPAWLAEKIVLWRNAEDVMVRREWWPVSDFEGGWYAAGAELMMVPPIVCADPAKAMVAAEEWYKANVENNQ